IAFVSERHLRPIGWTMPPIWDPIAGDYETQDGWIRLHTNYAHHRTAALAVLGGEATREAVAEAVRAWEGDALEQAVVDAGGCAARMRTRAAWQTHPQGRAVAAEPLCATSQARGAGAAGTVDHPAAPTVPRRPHEAYGGDGCPTGSGRGQSPDDGMRPLAGLRVLDLTRVIAGPVCTRFLAAWGAEVLRIDAPNFVEAIPVLADTTAGKRRTRLDLTRDEDRERFEGLLAEADVLVHGYRRDALERLDYGEARLRALAPHLVVTSLCAYGQTGPWAARRGFDSLVQMSCGIAERGQTAAASPRPSPLPAQALDHGTGYLMAAATIRALTDLHAHGRAASARLSLARTAEWLLAQEETGDPNAARPDAGDVAAATREVESSFGRLAIVGCPGALGQARPGWRITPGALGTDAAVWSRVGERTGP
ncbi:MAG TPA: CoA transferase, partial [Myxococcota bacterium]|nr:CoA transferase [Myxococcota bacterium]